MKKNLLLCFFIVFLTSACSMYRIDSEETTTEIYPSKKSAEEVIYLENVSQSHIEIGKVIVSTERNQSLENVIEKMKYEAAILGGDAITNIETNSTGTWKKLPAQKIVGNAYIRANFSATVVVFTK